MTEPGNKPVSIVTGASKGIGRAIADRLGREGHFVINLSRSAPEDPFPGVHFDCDLTDADDTAATLKKVLAQYQVDNLVNNAGLANNAWLHEETVEAWDNLMALNLRATFQCTQAVAEQMKARATAAMKEGRTLRADGTNGRLVMMGSRVGLGKTRRAAYSTSKMALLGFTKTVALELAPYRITVNTVGPGATASPFLIRNNPPEYVEGMAKQIPLGRLGTAEDAANVTWFLLTPDASFITGQVIYVCGGFTIGQAPG